MCEDGRHRKGILYLIQTLEVGYTAPDGPGGSKGIDFDHHNSRGGSPFLYIGWFSRPRWGGFPKEKADRTIRGSKGAPWRLFASFLGAEKGGGQQARPILQGVLEFVRAYKPLP